MTVPVLLALGVHPLGCSFEVHGGTCAVQPSTFRNPQSAFANCGKSPCFTDVFAFSREIELSQHSALMGGQFPLKKDFGAFKNPLFFDGFRGANRPKNELSFLMPNKTSFYTVFPAKVDVFSDSGRGTSLLSQGTGPD
jgi:hypothetical protein